MQPVPVGKAAQRDSAVLEAADGDADELEAFPSSLAAGKDSPLVALADAAAEGDLANPQPGEDAAATADAAPSATQTVTEPRRSSRNEGEQCRGRCRNTVGPQQTVCGCQRHPADTPARKRRAIHGVAGGPAAVLAAFGWRDKGCQR